MKRGSETYFQVGENIFSSRRWKFSHQITTCCVLHAFLLQIHNDLRMGHNPRCQKYLDQVEAVMNAELSSGSDADDLLETDESVFDHNSPPNDNRIDPAGDFYGNYDQYSIEDFGMDVDVDSERSIEIQRETMAEDERDDLNMEAVLAEDESRLEPAPQCDYVEDLKCHSRTSHSLSSFLGKGQARSFLETDKTETHSIRVLSEKQKIHSRRFPHRWNGRLHVGPS